MRVVPILVIAHVDGAFISIEFKLRDERFATYRDE